MPLTQLLPTSVPTRMISLAISSDGTMLMQQAAYFRCWPSQDSQDSHRGGTPEWSVATPSSLSCCVLPRADNDQHPKSCLSRPFRFQKNISEDPRVYFDASKQLQLPEMRPNGYTLSGSGSTKWRVLCSSLSWSWTQQPRRLSLQFFLHFF